MGDVLLVQIGFPFPQAKYLSTHVDLINAFVIFQIPRKDEFFSIFFFCIPEKKKKDGTGAVAAGGSMSAKKVCL